VDPAIHGTRSESLILGNRYEAKAQLPEEVLNAALPFVDVPSFQFFS
jgi:hypothetical protein